MSDMKRSTRRNLLRRALAALLALMLLPCALAEGWPTLDDWTAQGGAWPAEDGTTTGAWPAADGTATGAWPEAGWGDGAADGAAAQSAATDVFAADVRIGYVAQPGASLNPFVCNEQDLVSLNQLVFEPLVTLDENQQPAPMLADSWTHEGTEWTFTLRSGITFHNGASLTAYDVEATFNQFIAIGSGNPYSARLDRYIESMIALDERTLSVTARYAGYITLYAMNFPVVQSSTLNDPLPRGTGPFWYTRYDTDSAVRIEANPLWWQQQPTVASVAFRHYAEIGDALEGLQTGEVDMLATRSTDAALLRRLSNLTALDYGTTTYEMLVPNLSEDSPMSELNVRRAVMYAVDRATLASNAYLEMAVQSEVPVLPGTWLYESQSAQFYYSPERALQLLYDAGWSDMTGDTILEKLHGIRVDELQVEIVTYNEDTNSVRENAADMIAEYLTYVGMRASVTVVERDEIEDVLEDGAYDLALIGVNLSEIPVLQPLLATDGALNYSGYASGAMDNLILSTASAQSADELRGIYSQIQLKVVEDLPILGLLFRAGTVLSSRSLGGLSGIRAMDTFRGLQYLTGE